MSRAFLHVENSLSGRRWVGPDDATRRRAEAIAQDNRLPLALSLVLAGRGIAPAEAAGYLAPQLRDLLPDPMSLRDMDKAAERFVSALRGRERIAVFADYDVDGGASAALLIDWLRQMGHRARLYVPDRILEGYGPNVAAMAELGRDHELIICVDCGTLSAEPIAAAGCDVIVLDHHLGGEVLPPAVAVVNPNRMDEEGALAHLCAAAVVFLFLVEVNRRLKPAGAALPDLLAMLDLVALATVADVAPLIGVNRAFVRQGLRVMARRARPGLRALCDIGRLEQAPNSHALGFVLGPRINAGGRVGRADLGARLLSTADPEEAARLAEELDRLNADRREIEAAVRAEAMAQVEARGTDGPLVWAAGEGWHPGVVGIVAARLKESFGRPAIVIGLEGDEGKGSGRSVQGVDLGASVQRLVAEGLLLKGGGHRMAAGLTVRRGAIGPAMDRLAELLSRQGAGASAAEDLPIDGLLDAGAVTTEFIESVENAGPFGASCPAPRFALSDVSVQAQPMGEGHLRLRLTAGAARLDGVAFGVKGTPLGSALAANGHGRFHLAGRVEVNSWGGRSRPQIRVEDAAPV